MSSIEVKILRAFRDNYMYVVYDKLKKIAVAIDPAEPLKVVLFVKEFQLKLEALMITHHHDDHSAGNALLSETYPGIPIIGGDSRIPFLNNKKTDGEIFKAGGVEWKCLFTPCHTKGHLCYVSVDQKVPIMFTGDTVFSGGCGRFFEGDASDMLKCIQKISAFPLETKIYFGHEYTKTNLEFAVTVDEKNSQLLKYQTESTNKDCTTPSSLELELNCNPFFRTSNGEIQRKLDITDTTKVMHELRKRKDNF